MTYTPPPDPYRYSAEAYGETIARAAEEALRSVTDNGHARRPDDDLRYVVITALTAAAPIIAAEVRGQREAFLPSDTLDPAWIAGWHAAVDHVAAHIESGGESGPNPYRDEARRG